MGTDAVRQLEMRNSGAGRRGQPDPQRMTEDGGPKAEVSAQGLKSVGERPWPAYADVNPRVSPATAIEGIERLSCTLEVAHGLSVGLHLPCRAPQQCDQSRDPGLH